MISCLCQPFIDRSNACVLHVTLRSTLRPHPSCTMLKGTNAKPLWTLTLYFAEKAQCLAAKNHLQQAREISRRILMQQITRMLPNLPFSPHGVPSSSPGNGPSLLDLQSPRGDAARRHFSSAQPDEPVQPSGDSAPSQVAATAPAVPDPLSAFSAAIDRR